MAERGAGQPQWSLTTTVGYGVPYQGGAGNGSNWFGPGQALAPVAPPEVAGRTFDFDFAYNLQVRPRVGMGVTFPMLRALADNYDLLRMAIETRKDQLARMKWSIKPREKGQKVSPDKIKAMTAFFKKPDGVNLWSDWIRAVAESVLVDDALSLYKRRTRGGTLTQLIQVDGATIKPLIDDWGRPPEDGPAFQQILKGLPAVDYTLNDLLYRPRNRRVHTPYGYSPVEQIIMTVQIALNRQIFTLSYFTEGSVPDAFVGTPENWNPTQIATFQRHFDQMMIGDLHKRRRVRFMPGKTDVHETKDPELTGKLDEWLARLVCYAFNISPQALVQQVNRATADTQKELSEEEGLAPLLGWIAEWITEEIIGIEFGSPELEFAWGQDEQLEPGEQSTILKNYVDGGILTRAEARDRLGIETNNDPNAGILMVTTPTGPVPLNAFDIQQQAAEAARQAQAEANEARMAMLGQGGGKDGEDDGSGGDQRAGKDQPAGGDKNADGEVGKTAGTPFEKLLHLLVQAPDPERAKLVPHRTAMARAVAAGLRKTGKAVAKQARKILDSEWEKSAAAVLAKDDDADRAKAAADRDALIAEISDRIANGADLDDLQDMIAQVEAELQAVGLDTGAQMLAQISAHSSELTNVVNQDAVDYARRRAAEMVGMRYDGDGNLVENPNADYAIDQATRDSIRSTIADGLQNNIGTDAIADAIEESYGFSEERADLIAETEVARANMQSSLDATTAARDELGINLGKYWQITSEACDLCQGNADAGVIALDDAFPSGDDSPPGHPRCRCNLSFRPLTYRGSGADDTSEGDDT